MQNNFASAPCTLLAPPLHLAAGGRCHARMWMICISSMQSPVHAQAPLEANPRNSVIGFHDNSSALRGGPVTPTLPVVPGTPSALAPQQRDWDVLLTAETHNFPCAVAPYPGELGQRLCLTMLHMFNPGSYKFLKASRY